jgi:hypothetical protein
MGLGGFDVFSSKLNSRGFPSKTQDLKSKDELIGEILTLLSSPINNVLSSLKSWCTCR